MLPNEKYINLSFNNFTTLKPKEFIKAEKLVLLNMNMNPYFNFIENQTFLWNSNVEYLTFDGCGITQIYNTTFNRVPNLKGIELSNNKLETINNRIFTVNNKLKIINLSENDLIFINSAAFEYNNELSELIMDENPNFDFPEETFFLKNKNLKHFSCVDCGITKIYSKTFSEMENLRELYLSHNNIYEIDLLAFQMIRQLRRINLKYNDLEYVPNNIINDLKRLEQFDWDGNETKSSNISNSISQKSIASDTEIESSEFKMINDEVESESINSVKIIKSGSFSVDHNEKNIIQYCNETENIISEMTKHDNNCDLKKHLILTIIFFTLLNVILFTIISVSGTKKITRA